MGLFDRFRKSNVPPKLYHGTDVDPRIIMEHGLEPQHGDWTVDGAQQPKVVYWTPDPQEAWKYGEHVFEHRPTHQTRGHFTPYDDQYWTSEQPVPPKGLRKLSPDDPRLDSYLHFGKREPMSNIPPLTSNILDPVHNTLDPLVWANPENPEPTLKPEHRTWILTQITGALSAAGYEDSHKWAILFFTGSLTTYQYSEESDVDISIFVNSEHMPEWSRAEMIGVMVEAFNNVYLPGTTHDLQVYVVPKELKPHDLYQEGLRSGYDLLADAWFVPPDPTRVHDVEREYNESYTNALVQADKMERLLRYEPDKAVMLYEQMHRKRMRDHQKGKGDFSDSNIAYKMLSNRGLFDQLRDLGVRIAKK